ncbi:MAG: hypothetical protein DRI71_12145 [Bacteroidetes bacterium]|nr:MAG: hypothetical protein DRI71_12145 [Bacteroidota bacterium]
MSKLINRTYKGIEYIQLSSLPTAQAESLKATLTERTLIKILKDDVVLNDCVLYGSYEEWYAANTEEAVEEIRPVILTSKPSLNEPVPVA